MVDVELLEINNTRLKPWVWTWIVLYWPESTSDSRWWATYSEGLLERVGASIAVST